MAANAAARRALLKKLHRSRPRAKGPAPNPLRADPSKTSQLRRRFAAELKRRFSRLKRELVLLAQVEDAFGLGTAGGPPTFTALAANAFCPTGPGGGQNNSCSPKGRLRLPLTLKQQEEAQKARGERANTPIPPHVPLPDTLYVAMPGHAADKALAEGHSGETKGLLGHEHNRRDSVYLATDREVVRHYAGMYGDSKTLAVDLKQLDRSRLYYDANEPPNLSDKKPFGLDNPGYVAYRGRIPSSAFREVTYNKFCATGEGGKVDPSCGKDDTGSGGGATGGAGAGGKEFTAAVPSPASAAATAFKATLAKLGSLGAKASHLEHLASSYLKDKLGDGISRLPGAVQAAVHGSLAVSRVGMKGLFANWTAAQTLAERVSREKGATPEQARRLRGILSSVDMKAFEVLKVGSLAGAHMLHGPMAAAAIFPPATASYLAYNTARHPMATLRAATGLVKDAAGSAAGGVAGAGRKIAGLFPARGPRPPRPQRRQARPGVEELTRNRSANDRVRKLADELARHQYDDWYVALLSAALTGTGSLEEALKVAAKAHKTTPKDPTDDARPPAQNAFCPTGEGGGIDPTCSPGEARASSPVSLADLSKSTQFLGNIPGGGKPTKAEAIAKVLLERAVDIGAEKAPFTTKAVSLRKVEVDGVEFAWQHGEKGLQAAARTLA